MSTSEFDLERLWDSLPGPGQQAAEGDDKLRSLWESLPGPKPESTVGRQFARGFAEAGLATGAGLAKLLPDRFLSEDSRLRNENIEAMHQGARERLAGWAGEADTGLEKAAGVLGRLAGEAALFVGSGMGAGAVARGAARALPAASRAGRFAQAVARPTTMGQRIARDFVTGTPVTAAIASAGAEESTIGGIAELTDSERLRRVAENPAARIAADIAIDGALGAVVEGGIAGIRAARRALDAGDAVEAGLRDVAPEDLAPTRDVFSPYDEQPPMPPPKPTPPPSYLWVPVEPMSQRAVALDRARRIAAETEQVPAPQPRYPIIEAAEPPPRYPIIEPPPPPRQGAPEAPAEVRVERAPGVVPLTEARPASTAPTAGGRRVRAKQHVRTKPEYTASPQPGTRIERPVVVGGRGTPSEPPPPSLAWTIPSVMHPHGRSVDDPWLERRARPPVQGPEAPEVTAESTARLRAPQGEPPAPSTAREAVREPEAPEVREAPASTAVDEDAPDELGGASPAVAGALARTGAGAVAGGIADAAVGEDQSPIEGMIAGAALAAGAPAAIRAVRGRGASEAAEAATEAVTGPVITDEVLQAEIRRAQADLRRPAPTPTPPGVEIDPDEFVNVSKFALSPESEALLREQVTEVVREQGLAPKKSVSWEETRKIADQVAKQIGLDPDQLDDAKLKRGRLNGPEMLAIRGVVSANVDQIETLSRQIETGLKADGTPLSAEELDALAMRVARLEEDNGKLLDAFIRSRTQTGRDLNNLKILANRTLDPATWLAKAQRTAGAPLPAAVQAEIRKLIQKGDREGLIAYVAGLRKAGAGEKLTTLWKAGLLTGPPTHVANLLGNLAMATLETAKDVPAYYFDRMVSTLTGVQTKYRPSARTIGARLEGAKEGAGKAAEIFGVKDALAAVKAGDGAKEAARRFVERIRRHDLTESDIRKLDFGRFVNFDNAFLDVYTKGVFKALAAGDRVFKTAALFGSLDEQARLIAKAEGLKGEAFEARVRELINRPTDEMSLRAIADAEIATFQNRGALAKLIGSAKQSLRTSHPVVHAVIETVFPFVTTPANIATRVVEYSPLGALRSLHDLQRLARKVVDEAEIPAVQKRAVETLGRAATGSGAAIALGYYLASKDLMTGAYPSEQRQRNAWELEGKQEYSVKIGDKWWSLERISPLGQLLIVGAQMHDFLADPRPMQEKLSEYAAQGSKMLVEMTPLQGFESFMELLNEGRGAFIESLAGSIVPAAVGRVARVGDPYVRVSEGPIERIQSRIPIARQRLPTKINVLGEDVQANPGVVSNILDPFNARQASDDPLVLELERVGAGLPTLAKRPQESEEAYRERQRLYGQVARLVLESVIQSPEYQQWPELARWIVENVPEAAGTDPDEWAKMQQRELLEDAITQARRKLSQQLSGR